MLLLMNDLVYVAIALYAVCLGHPAADISIYDLVYDFM